MIIIDLPRGVQIMRGKSFIDDRLFESLRVPNYKDGYYIVINRHGKDDTQLQVFITHLRKGVNIENYISASQLDEFIERNTRV